MARNLVLALTVLASSVVTPAAASAAPALMDGNWKFTGDIYSDDFGGRAECRFWELAYEQTFFNRDYDCHWAVPLASGVVGLWYR